jgi:hypothetical protein
LCLLLLLPRHLRQSGGEPPAGATQKGHRHLQIALHLFDRRRLDGRGLPLRFQTSGVTSKPAIRGHFKTGQRNRTQNMFVLP